jgi:hypothetical protein
MTKEEILGKTQGGLAVFRHFVTGNWKVGRNFLNPFYNDTKASCNVYFDKGSKQYKIKDFGDIRFNGDCFTLVALLHQLDVRAEFGEVLRIIASEMGLNSIQKEKVAAYPPSTSLPQAEESPKTKYDIKTKAYTETERLFWKSYGIDSDILRRYNVISILYYTAINKKGQAYSIRSSKQEPIFGYVHQSYVKVYRPFSEPRFQFLGYKPNTYIFGLDCLPPRGDVLFITGGEKDVLSLAARGFSAICFNSESAAIPSEVIKKLSYRFRHIVLLYDVDKAGLEAMKHHQEQLNELEVKTMLLPLAGTKEEKDVSDFFRLGKTSEELKRLFNQLLENLYAQTFAMLRSCEIDFNNPPIAPSPLVMIAGVPIGSPGNLLGITGGEGSGKSNFLGGILAGALAKPTQGVDSLGTRVSPNRTGKSVLYFDTEQSEDQLYRNLTIVLERCELNSPPDWFKAYCLTNLSRRERLQVILQSVDRFHHQFGGVHLIVIDGIGDLIGSLNDERESINLIEELHRMAGIYQTCILCVLHLVPNGIKLRGHLGSELQRKSAGILCIEKEESTEISCVRALKVRSGSPLDVPLIQFAWDKKKGYHVYLGEKAKDNKLQRKIDDLASLAEEVFKTHETVTYTEMMNSLAEMMGVKERMAKNYIGFMVKHGIVEHHKKGRTFSLGAVFQE